MMLVEFLNNSIESVGGAFENSIKVKRSHNFPCQEIKSTPAFKYLCIMCTHDKDSAVMLSKVNIPFMLIPFAYPHLLLTSE